MLKLRSHEDMLAPPAKIGPLFRIELLRMARRGRTAGIRSLYILALLAALGLAYVLRFGTPGAWLDSLFGPTQALPRNALAGVGETFAYTLLLAQVVAVLVLTPAYACGLIVEERERGTLDLLFTTNLTGREIVLGKLLARLFLLAGVLLAGLPVLCLVQLWGGVQPEVVLTMFVATSLTLLSTGAVGALCSVVQRTRVGALFLCYLIVGPLTGIAILVPWGHLASPVPFLAELDARVLCGGGLFDAFAPGVRLGPVAAAGPSGGTIDTYLQLALEYSFVHGLVSIALLWAAVALLRRPRDAMLAGNFAVPRVVFCREEQPVHASSFVTWRFWPLPPVGDRPLRWKEKHADSSLTDLLFLLPGGVCVGVLMFMTLCSTLIYVVASGTFAPELLELRHREEILANVNLWQILGTMSGGLTACLAVGFRAAATVTRERERGTLEGLLCLPVNRGTMLLAKWFGTLSRLRFVAFLLVLLWASGVALGAIHPVAAVLLALTLLAHVLFLGSAGLWLTVVCRSSLRSQVAMAVLVLLLFAGPWLVQAWLEMPQTATPGVQLIYDLVRGGMNPLGAWHACCLPWGASPGAAGDGSALTSAVFGAVVYMVGSLLLLEDAQRRFRVANPDRLVRHQARIPPQSRAGAGP